MTDELWRLDAVEIADRIRSHDIKAREASESCLARIDDLNEPLTAFVYIDGDGALRQADEIDRRIANGEDPGPLAGVPMGVKDLEDAAGMPTTHGSLLFAENIPAQDSIQVSRLRRAGAVIVGKTAAPEFGATSYTESRVFGVTRNPWNLDRTPGGSSGGSAAAVAAGISPLCTGSDGGGSVRIPASYSGLVGPKPTYGLIPNGPEYDGMTHSTHMGPLCRSVRDAARYLDVVAGTHPSDPFSIPSPVDSFEVAVDAIELKGLRVAWSDTLGFGTCDTEVSEIARSAAYDLVESAGMVWVDADVRLKDPARAWQTQGAADTLLKLRPYWPERKDDLSPVIRAAMEYAGNLPIIELAIAAKRVHDLGRSVGEYFDDFDLLLTPTAATVAYDAAGPMPMVINGEPVKPMGSLPFTYPFNLTGHPATSVPAGLSSEGLPVGLQIVARRREDALTLRSARILEEVRPWQKFAPYALG